MAVDSIIARPTNKVRVMVAEASGCCASAVRAVETAFPSARAGPRHPKLMVRPAMTIDATAIRVMLSIIYPLVDLIVNVSNFCCLISFRLPHTRCRRDVNSRQNAEDISLHHASQQTEYGHDDRENERRNSQQNTDDHRSAHHIAEQSNRQG